MRTTLQLLLVAVFLFRCATVDQPSPPSGSNGQRIRALYDAFARGDVPTVMGSFDPEIVWMEAENTIYADRNPYRGPQAVAEGVFMRLGQDWRDFKVNVDRIVDGGDTVVALGRYTGTHRGTSQPLNAQFAHVWSVRNGKIVGFQQYADTAQFARVTGAWK